MKIEEAAELLQQNLEQGQAACPCRARAGAESHPSARQLPGFG
jgi:hypothetical protein